MEPLDGLEGVDRELRERLAFLISAHGLSKVFRLNRLVDGSRRETAAEHSWHVALAAMVFAPVLAPEVDLGRVLELLIVHDLPEIEVGDVPIYEEARRSAVAVLEPDAAALIFGAMPVLFARWEEFEAALTPEARFARAVDRLQPMLLHWACAGVVWRDRAIRREQLDRLVEVVQGFWPALAGLARAIVADAASRGYFAEPAAP